MEFWVCWYWYGSACSHNLYPVRGRSGFGRRRYRGHRICAGNDWRRSEKTVLDPNNTGVGRIAPSDQFTLSITNANGNQFDKRGSATTTGAELGEQKDAQ